MRETFSLVAPVAAWLILAASAFGDGLEDVKKADDLRLWYETPAGPWEEALPVGNGRLGAMVFGGTSDERIQFNEDSLWTGKPHDRCARLGATNFEEIRHSSAKVETRRPCPSSGRSF